jgi:outer membrane protein assembly factor BamB
MGKRMLAAGIVAVLMTATGVVAWRTIAGPGERPTITAYDASDGARRWTAHPKMDVLETLAVSPTAVDATGANHLCEPRTPASATLDPATGRRRPGSDSPTLQTAGGTDLERRTNAVARLVSVQGGLVLRSPRGWQTRISVNAVADYRTSGWQVISAVGGVALVGRTFEPGMGNGPTVYGRPGSALDGTAYLSLFAFDASSGTLVWSDPSVYDLSLAVGNDRLFEVRGHGGSTLVTRDLRTGRVLSSNQWAAASPPLTDSNAITVHALGHHFLISSGYGRTVILLDDHGRELWRREFAETHEPSIFAANADGTTLYFGDPGASDFDPDECGLHGD